MGALYHDRLNRLILWRSLGPQPPVVIIETDDVIFAEVITMLNLNEYQRVSTGVVNPVGNAARDIDGIACPHLDCVAIQSDHPLSGDHEPVLGAARMPLVAESLRGAYLDRLDLESLCLSDDYVAAPRTLGVFCHPTILPEPQTQLTADRPTWKAGPSSRPRAALMCQAASTPADVAWSLRARRQRSQTVPG